MKKFVAIMCSVVLMLTMITTVSATENAEYVTFDLTTSGANGIIFGTEEDVENIMSSAADEYSNENSASEYIQNYISAPQSKDNGRGKKVTNVLRKDTFEGKLTDGIIYETNEGKIPFKISTDLSKKNGFLIGGNYTSAQTATLNADKFLSTLYFYHISITKKDVTAKIVYTDGYEETKTVTFKGNDYNDTNISTGLWGPKFSMKYNLTYELSGTKNDAGYDMYAITKSNDADRAAAIAQVDVNTGKKIKNVILTHTDSWSPIAIVGITGEVASAEEITVATIADLKTKYADASAVTISNYEAVKEILDTLNAEYIPAEDAEYIIALTNAVNGFVASVDGVISKYDYIDLSTVKNAPLAANVGDECTVRSFSHTANNYQYVMNIAAINNKKVKGYTFSDNNVPFDVSASNGNYGVRVSGVGETGINTTESVTLTEPARYNSLSIMGATGTSSSERNEIYVQVTYSDGKTAKFTGATMKSQQVVKKPNDTTEITSGDQVSYEVDENNINNTAGTLLIGNNGYYANTNYWNMYVPVYTVELDNTKEVASIQVGCTLSWSSFTVVAMSAEKVTLADVIDTIEVTKDNYKEIDDMINELPAGDLTLDQQAKLEMIKKHIKFYVQDYVTFDIDSFSNGVGFLTDGTPADSIDKNKFINIAGNASVLNKEGWEAQKDENGLVYAVNGIPFDVNTNGIVLFGRLNGASVTIDIEDGNYDSISALLGYTNLNAATFEMKVEYTEGEPTVDADWNIQGYHYTKNPFLRGDAAHIKDSDSYFGFSNPTLRNQAEPTQYTVFNTQYYFPVVTLDVDKNRVVDKVVFTNSDGYVDIALLGLTGSKTDSTNKTLTRVFNSAMKHFSDAELEAAHSAYVNSYDAGLYTNETYGLEPMDVIYLKHSDNVLSGKVMSYVNEDNDYTVVAIVLNADGSFDRVEIMGQGTANLSAHDFSETIVLEEGQKINVLLWESFATLKPYMTAKDL